MERKLLLLGILRNQEMYGYQLNEYIDNSLAACVDLKRPTAYYLLNKMEADGWVVYQEDQDGKRPTRRIYSITSQGEAAYQRLLRENLRTYAGVNFDDDIGLAFLDTLDGEEALALLQLRREGIVEKMTQIKDIPIHPGSYQWMIEHQARHLENELAWVDTVIEKITNSEVKEKK